MSLDKFNGKKVVVTFGDTSFEAGLYCRDHKIQIAFPKSSLGKGILSSPHTVVEIEGHSLMVRMHESSPYIRNFYRVTLNYVDVLTQ